jgi:ferric-dicitrate binding protein FerR (iron transport regulator)
MNEELLIHFLTKTCTKEEMLEVENWISTGQANADWLFGLERVWALKDEIRYSDREELESAYRRFINIRSQNTGQEQAVKRSLYNDKEVRTHGTNTGYLDKEVRTHGTNTGSQAVVRPLYRGWLKYAVAIAIVCLLATNIYQAFKNKPSGEAASNVIEVPVGQRVAITLADGTKVWLNSGSILSYPTKFDNKNRAVRLDGEGYFEVTADEAHPFIVNTFLPEIKVLGTKFNVQAYPDEDIAVSLLEGHLHVQAGVQSVLMEADELVTWSKESGLVHHKNKTVQHTAQWVSGELMFVDERLTDITKALERHFGVTITISNPGLADETFTCRTQPKPTLEQVMNMLKNTKKLNYTIHERTVNIY